MKKLLLMAAAIPAVASAAACGNDGTGNQWGECPTNASYIMAVTPDEGGSGPKPGTASVIEVMEDILDKDIETIDITNTANSGLAIASCQVDLMWGSSATYWESEFNNNTIDIIAAHSDTDQWADAGYDSLIITHQDTIDELIASGETQWQNWESWTEEKLVEELKGKNFSFGGETSTSGTIAPREWFWQNTKASDYTTKSDILQDGVYFNNAYYGNDHEDNIADILDSHSANREQLFSSVYDNDLYRWDYDANAGHSEDDIVILNKIQVAPGPLWGNMSDEDQVKLKDAFEKITSETHPELYFELDSNGDPVVDGDHSQTFFEGLETARLFGTDKNEQVFQNVKNMNDPETFTR